MRRFGIVQAIVCASILCVTSISFAGASEPASFFHDAAWKEAVTDPKDDQWCYAIYNYRSLMVHNPEIYLQADSFWIDNIARKLPGWGDEYLFRDRMEDGYQQILHILDMGNRGGTQGKRFSWNLFRWKEHVDHAISLEQQYRKIGVDASHPWLDRKIPFIWSAIKGEDWQTDPITLAECLFLQLKTKNKRVWFVISATGDAFVAEYRKRQGEVVIHDPLRDSVMDLHEFAEKQDPVLIMNERHVWYPLMERDDRERNDELRTVVSKIARESAVPRLNAFESSLRSQLVPITTLASKQEERWAFLFALRIGTQAAWKVKPILDIMNDYFPSRYQEAKRVNVGSADIPYELTALNMLITEMSNRLSPVSAMIAGHAATKTDERAIFTAISDQYLRLFVRTDSNYHVYGDYYRIWLPTIEDKMVSKVGDCFVEATNVGSVLSLLQITHPGWSVYVSNWWDTDRNGGHVIAGIYSEEAALSLSNGVFGKDSVTLRGPLYSFNGRFAYGLFAKTREGVLTTVQDGNNARYRYRKPFSTMTADSIVRMVEELHTYEPSALFVVGDSIGKTYVEGEKYREYLDEVLESHAPFVF